MMTKEITAVSPFKNDYNFRKGLKIFNFASLVCGN